MENREHIDEHLKNSLLGFEIQPRISSFDQVMLKLEKRKRRRFFVFFLSGMITLAGLLILVSGIKNNASDPGMIVSSGKQVSTPAKAINVPSKTTSANTKFIKNSSQKTVNKNGFTIPAGSVVINKKKTIPAAKKETEVTFVPEEIAEKGRVDEIPVPPAEQPPLKNQQGVYDLQPHSLLLEPETRSTPIDERFLVFSPVAEEKQPVKKNKNQYFIGVYFSPQLSTLHFSENPDRHERYNADGGLYAARYLQTRKDLNDINLSRSLGLKFGMLVNDRWEFYIGLGLQKWNYEETNFLPSPPVNYNTPNSLANSNINPQTVEPGVVMNELNYISLSLETSRIWHLRSISIKAGGGFALQQLYSSDVITVVSPSHISNDSSTGTDTRSTLITPFLKMGFIEEIGPRFNFHLSPFIYYNPYSSFNKEYIIKQKFYGVGLEAMIAVRI